MSSRGLVTVYITNFNYGRFIRQAIESVLNQTYSPIELLIIDDGSTDNSIEIIDCYRNYENIKIIKQKNKGLNATNNVALKEAQGDYFIRLDADDYMANYAIAMMVALLEGNPEIGLVFPDYYYVDEVGNIIGVEHRHNFDSEVSLFDLPSHGACTMVRTKELKKMGGYSESFTCQDGYELWLKYILKSRVTNISKPLFFYRQHKDNLTRNETKIIAERKKIKSQYVSEQNIPDLKSVAIIPVRPTRVNGKLWALYQTNGLTQIQHAVKKIIESNCFDKVIVTSSSDEVLLSALELNQMSLFRNNNVNIVTHKRKEEYELANYSLETTISEIINKYGLNKKYDAIALLGIETPKIKECTIREAVHTLRLFKANCVICVRQDYSSYFTHNGNGMKLVYEKSKYKNYERKILYKRISGFTICLLNSYMSYNSFITDRIGHIVISSEESLTIESVSDLEIYKHLI